MNVISPELERQVLHPVMHQKIPLRAAELVEQGWTRGTAARDADGQKVRSMAPRAIGWCVVGAVDRALYELLNLDVYDLLGLDVDDYDTAPCPAGVMKSRGQDQGVARPGGCPHLAGRGGEDAGSPVLLVKRPRS
jgi:hypothetical protein